MSATIEESQNAKEKFTEKNFLNHKSRGGQNYTMNRRKNTRNKEKKL